MLTSARSVWTALRRRKRVVFGVLEWAELVSAFENDRASPATLVEWCDFKLRFPTYRVSKRDALGVIGGEVVGPRNETTLGAVLAAWGLEIERVLYGEDVPT